MIQLYHNLNIEVYQDIFLNMNNFVEIDFNQTWNRNTNKDENQFIRNHVNELENSHQIRSIKTNKEPELITIRGIESRCRIENAWVM